MISALASHAGSRRALLIVLDGFGNGPDSPFNAIRNARKPFLTQLLNRFPSSQLLTHGESVGLPDGVMGNSEVGHMTMGSGRIQYQDLTRISKHIRDKSFFKLEKLNHVFKAAQVSGRIHFIGLVSDGGVHSHISHLEALLDASLDQGIPQVYIHVITDGRDTAPTSGLQFLERLMSHAVFKKESRTQATIASIHGRYYAMDRDKRWDRVEKSYRVLVGDSPTVFVSPTQALQSSYDQGKEDEFVEPIRLAENGIIRDQDTILFFNYRSDRARELTEAFTVKDFTGFIRGTHEPNLNLFSTMTEYDPKVPTWVLFEPVRSGEIFGGLLERLGKTQIRIAETEKYAHVTFFFNGGREKPFLQEDRILIPSPKDIATYDLKPEMSADEVAAEARRQIESQKYDFILINFANADMVGHTGMYEPTVKAIETLDRCLALVVGAAEKNGYNTLITADHGNAEEMCNHEGKPFTQHTLNPVPLIWVQPDSSLSPTALRGKLNDGGLVDITPTLCEIMGIETPPLTTGKSLIQKL